MGNAYKQGNQHKAQNKPESRWGGLLFLLQSAAVSAPANGSSNLETNGKLRGNAGYHYWLSNNK